MAFTLQLTKTTKARNSTLIPPLSISIQCLLKDNTSIIKPVFKLHLNKGGCPSLDELAQMNYCYCSNFKRYYFITDIQSETAAVAYVSCEVDVLATFKEDILATPAFVITSESHYNPLVPDNRLPMLGTSRQWCNMSDVSIFSQEGCFALTAVTPDSDGSTGTAATVVVGKLGLSTIASKLYTDDFWEAIKNDFYHPEEAIIGCMWTPIRDDDAIGGGPIELKIGKYSLGVWNSAAKVVAEALNIQFHIPYTAQEEGVAGNLGDYRNFEPYSKYFVTLPGVGTVDIPMKVLCGNAETLQGDLTAFIDVAASPVTGDVTYNIKLKDMSGGGIIGSPVGFTVKGNFGVEIPISRAVGRFGSVLQAAVGGVSGIVGGSLIGGPLGAGIGMVSTGDSISNAALEAMNVNTNIVGSLGGWSVLPAYNYNIESKTIAWDISDEPSAIRPTIGRPYYHHVSRLGVCKGMVQCTGAFVKTWATEEEHSMISQYVNSSVNYLYGGVIIE